MSASLGDTIGNTRENIPQQVRNSPRKRQIAPSSGIPNTGPASSGVTGRYRSSQSDPK
jgi:hypothetical protein